MRRAKRGWTVWLAALTLVPATVRAEQLADLGTRSGDVVLAWNAQLLAADAADHARAEPDQGGPTRASRAFAIVSAAMFDACNSITHRCEPYLVELSGYERADRQAAITAAAYHTLVALYPHQEATFDQALEQWLARLRRSEGRTKGLELGEKVAKEILAARVGDRSDAPSVYAPTNPPEPGHHQEDPNNPGQGFLTPQWGNVMPFVLDDIDSFLPPPPPALASQEYANAYREVMLYGGDGNTTPTLRTAEQTEIGIFWAYDGRPGLGTPPRLYNQIVRAIALEQGNSTEQNARLLALVNLAMADAGICCWRGKYIYDFWRPIVAIRAGEFDGNDQTAGDPLWNPLGAPRTNGEPGQPNFTPPFPAYTSGHATFGAAALWTVANFYRDPNISFSLVSDEFNGVNADQNGNVRPRVKRHFKSLIDAIEENAQSRIYLGIHWSFDARRGVNAGRAIADFVSEHALRPRDRR